MKGSHILLIDDDTTINYLNKIIIERAKLGVQVSAFTDATVALKELADGTVQPQLILLDLNMPAMDGWKFLDAYRELSQSQSDRKIVILSSSINPADQQKAKENDLIAAFYRKPLSIDQIKEIHEVVINNN